MDKKKNEKFEAIAQSQLNNYLSLSEQERNFVLGLIRGGTSNINQIVKKAYNLENETRNQIENKRLLLMAREDIKLAIKELQEVVRFELLTKKIKGWKKGHENMMEFADNNDNLELKFKASKVLIDQGNALMNRTEENKDSQVVFKISGDAHINMNDDMKKHFLKQTNGGYVDDQIIDADFEDVEKE